MHFQDVIAELQKFWADKGCVIWQPWDIETGAGTFNPATFLRCLGPEPWKVCYVEPSRRPADGRYGENPNRLGHYYQYQVILKPSPADVQELYLDSLRALGIDPLKHDIRFVEDDWESPTLGAWGLGWEVWADGMEITQFTYFQQAGGLDCRPVSAELTYGLERIAMFLQGVDSVFDLTWLPGVSYGDVHRRDEWELSTYNFEVADVSLHHELFDKFEAEAFSALEKECVLPAYDCCLRCSHVFNVLDARGAISVTERQAYILRVRKIAFKVAEAFVEARRKEGFPLLKADEGRDGDEGGQEERGVAASSKRAGGIVGEVENADLLFEIGIEEVPAGELKRATEQLPVMVKKGLDERRLAYGDIKVFAAPRRLAVCVEDVEGKQVDVSELVMGPPAAVAFDKGGNPSKAAEGFARKMGVDVTELQRVKNEKGEYVACPLEEKGLPAVEVLPDILKEVISGLRFRKSMRWGDGSETFVRPVQWIVALFGEHVLEMEYAGVRSGKLSRGHRFSSPEPFAISHPGSYLEDLRERMVLADHEERRRVVREQIKTIESEYGMKVRPDEALLEEVVHLTEWPVAVCGKFDEEFLEVEPEVLVAAMRTHQRYFAMEDGEGNLAPRFVTILGTQVNDSGVSAEGNERVLAARLADARFFRREDLKIPLKEWAEGLKNVTYQKKLGSMKEKVERVARLARELAPLFGADPDVAHEAALLSKADLVTHMVGEFPELQGVMGRKYALQGGLGEEISAAIYEHYLPRGPSDPLPVTGAGVVTSLADKLDTIVGGFGAGLKPKGSGDPFGLRRAALGFLRIILERGVRVDMAELVETAAGPFREDVTPPAADVLEFFKDRLRSLLSADAPGDVVRAVFVAEGSGEDGTNEMRESGIGWDPCDISHRINAVLSLQGSPEFGKLATAFRRTANIFKQAGGEAVEFKEDLLKAPEEKKLWDELTRVRKEVEADLDAGDYETALKKMAGLGPWIDAFFDNVRVLDSEKHEVENRLALLREVDALFRRVADFKIIAAG